MSKLIEVSHHNTYEDWLVVYEDGSIIYHYELDGWAAKNGIKPSNELVTLSEVRQRFPQRVEEVEEALRGYGQL